MPILSHIERKSPWGRLLLATVYLVLVLGAVTMLYPMLIMLSSSMASEADIQRHELGPWYLVDDARLWHKYLHLKYGDDYVEFVHRYRFADGPGSFRLMTPKPPRAVLSAGARQRVLDWWDFVATLQMNRVDVQYADRYGTGPVQQAYQRWLKAQYETVERYNHAFTTPLSYRSLLDVMPPEASLAGHAWPPEGGESHAVWEAFKATLEPRQLKPLSLTHLFQRYLQDEFATVEAANTALGTAWISFFDAEFNRRQPDNPELAAHRERFIRTVYPLRLAHVPGDHTPAWRAYILAQPDFGGSPEAVDKALRQASALSNEAELCFEALHWTPHMPHHPLLARLWAGYVDTLPLEAIRCASVVDEFRDFLRRRYGRQMAKLNAAHGTQAESFDTIDPPFADADLLDFIQHKIWLKRHFLLGNYLTVLRAIATQGRALRNTVVLVLLSLLGSLTVQPMAAYALSRFRLGYANAILIFLIATMSFPAAVTMIPNFLLLKKLNLLNTYAALVLPGLVQGMGIFLLKGYFDSLPRELYEAGTIDGASELQMFLRITFPLSAPILAVLALNTFMAAYGSFMWAFLICQKESMWTLMVFLFQFQQTAPPSTFMAALLLAAIPTLIVFIFAQRIIMRGIAIPTMK